MLNRFNQVFDSIDTQNQHFTDKDKGQTVLHEQVNRRLRTITNEIDDLRKQLDGQVVIVRRIEAVETKSQDIWELMEEVKQNSQAAQNDQFMREIQSLTSTVFSIKSAMHKELEDYKLQV